MFEVCPDTFVPAVVSLPLSETKAEFKTGDFFLNLMMGHLRPEENH